MRKLLFFVLACSVLGLMSWQIAPIDWISGIVRIVWLPLLWWSAIGGLLLAGSPADVAGFVMAIVIFSVYGVLWARSRPESFQILSERFKEELYTAPSIAVEMLRSRIDASVLGGQKALILLRSMSTNSCPVFSIERSPEASTTSRLTIPQLPIADKFDGSAITLAGPCYSSIIPMIPKGNWPHNKPSPEMLSGQILKFVGSFWIRFPRLVWHKYPIYLLILLSAMAVAQNVRIDVQTSTISSSNPPYLVANNGANVPTLSVCSTPANAVPCTNYVTTFDGLGNACPNGAQDTPNPDAQTSACQPTADASGNLGWWIPAGEYDFTYCVGNSCFGPFTFTAGGSGGGSGTITGVLTASGSGLQGGGTSGTLNIALQNGSAVGQTEVWNGSAWFPGFAPSVWSALISPTANLNLALSSSGVPYLSTFTCGDFGVVSTNCWTITDSSISTTDKTYDLNISVPPTSYHNALNVSVDGFAQLQVCSLGGSSHLGMTVIGNIIPCGSINTSSYGKLTIMDNSPAHTGLRVYQNNVTATADLVQFNTAATAGLTFNFATWCASAVSGGDTTCASPLGAIRGNGSILAPNFLSNVAGNTLVLNGVTLFGQPSGTGQCPTSTSTSAASWQSCGSGGGGGTGTQFQTAVYTGTNVIGSVANGITGQQYISQNLSYPLFASAGVPGSTVSAATYTVLCDSATATRDRVSTITLTNAAPTVTVPDPTDSGCGANFTFSLLAGFGSTVTVTRETSGVFNTFTGQRLRFRPASI